MHVEVSVALNFVISYLYNKLPRRRVDMFGEELEKGIKNKFEGHWYDDKPYKGSAYRCIRVSTEKVEPVMEIAASLSRLDIEEIKEFLPKDLTIWIDPGEVSYRIGEKGLVKVLYSSRGDNESFQGVDKEIAIASKGFNPDAQCFKPIDSLSSSLSNLSVSPGTASPTPTPSAPVTSGATSPWGTGSVSPIGPGRSYGSTSPSGSTGSSGPANSTPIASFLNRNQQNNTMTTAMFAQTKFGSTKLKTQAKRPSRLSPTELGAYIKQRSPPQSLSAGASCPTMQQHSFGTPTGQAMTPRSRTLSPRSPVRAPGSMHPMALDGGQNRLQHYFLMQQQVAAQGATATGNLHGAMPSGMASPLYGSMSDLYGTMLGPFTPSPSYGGHSNNTPGFQEMFPPSASPNGHLTGGISVGSSSVSGLGQNIPSPDAGLSHKTLIDSLNQNNLANYPSLQHLLVAN